MPQYSNVRVKRNILLPDVNKSFLLTVFLVKTFLFLFFIISWIFLIELFTKLDEKNILIEKRKRLNIILSPMQYTDRKFRRLG